MKLHIQLEPFNGVKFDFVEVEIGDFEEIKTIYQQLKTTFKRPVVEQQPSNIDAFEKKKTDFEKRKADFENDVNLEPISAYLHPKSPYRQPQYQSPTGDNQFRAPSEAQLGLAKRLKINCEGLSMSQLSQAISAKKLERGE